ncbi:MAG TPA: hypothetical protein VF525_07975 [Pyrinomonadaceae bacterium]
MSSQAEQHAGKSRLMGYVPAHVRAEVEALAWPEYLRDPDATEATNRRLRRELQAWRSVATFALLVATVLFVLLALALMRMLRWGLATAPASSGWRSAAWSGWSACCWASERISRRRRL